ncbi:uncharacterized protein (TIGR02246 family) [Sphingomonas zeicaulis]|uniref:SgcJ/EcaC family oxidoreductase n=1 Tax=Sphingomonas zeicaulis TaxID=1632740 RepID=UPI003D248B5F
MFVPSGLRLVFAVSVATSAAHSQPLAQVSDRTTDEMAIKRLASTWEMSWNKRDAAGLASIMDPEIVFVSVLGPDTPGHGRGGRAAFQAAHSAMLTSSMFSDSHWTNQNVSVVRWLAPDIAVVHVSWQTTGDRVRHLPAGTVRRGLFTWVVQRQAGKWFVAASQNTEALPPMDDGHSRR